MRRSPSHRASRGFVTPKSGNNDISNNAQRDQEDDISTEVDSVTLGHPSNEGDIVKTITKDPNEKDNKRKYPEENIPEDINLDSAVDSLSESSKYYHTSELEDDDDDNTKEQEEEEDDRWDMDFSKSNAYSDWINNDMLNDYTITGVKNQLLFADILKHIRKNTVFWMLDAKANVYKYECALQPREPEIGIETAKRRYRKAVDTLLVPSINNRDQWISYKIRCKFLQAMGEFLWTMKHHCERELFLQQTFKIESFRTWSSR
ncbi:hypothetical protein TMatcc_008007 [Talaromyces marneffei ATCC 18224]